jgi:predicted GTPase
MSHGEARNHFEKARMNTADAVTIEMLDGLIHLSHAIEEDFRTLEQNIRNIEEAADRHRTLGPVYPMP